MNATKSITAAVCATLFCSAPLFGQGITTLICQGGLSSAVQITASQTARIKSYWDSYVGNNGQLARSIIQIQSGTNSIQMSGSGLLANGSGDYGVGAVPFEITGPATISLITSANNSPVDQAILTLDIEPGPYPPGRTAVVGSNSGNVQVTMQISTDLVNWTTAVNGQVYTNSPIAAFFRIQLIPNASP